MQEGIDALVDYASSEAGEQCIAAGLGSVYAGAEDLATLGGVGLALKGLKGAALSTRVSATVRRVLYENSLALHPGVGANPSTLSRLIGGFVVGTGVDAGFEEAGGGSYNGRAFLTGLLPVANLASATASAVETCRGR